MATIQLKRRRAGFTLIEVLVSLVILGIALVGAQALLTDRLVSGLGKQDRRMVAIHLAAERMQVVQSEPSYEQLNSRYATTETAIAGAAGFTRATTVSRTYTPATRVDYTTVTITVSHPELTPAVVRTVVIAAP